MKRVFVWYAVAVMLLTLAAQAKDNMGATEKAVAGLEQQWVDAGKAGNPEPIAPLLAENFVNTTSDGKVIGKAESLAQSKASKWEICEINDPGLGRASHNGALRSLRRSAVAQFVRIRQE